MKSAEEWRKRRHETEIGLHVQVSGFRQDYFQVQPAAKPRPRSVDPRFAHSGPVRQRSLLVFAAGKRGQPLPGWIEVGKLALVKLRQRQPEARQGLVGERDIYE